MEETPITDWMSDIQRTARRAVMEWPDVNTTADDLVDEVVVHILERPGTAEDLAEMDEDHRYKTLHKIMQRVVSGERVKDFQFSGNFRYSEDEVRELLKETGESLITPTLGSSWRTGDYTRNGTNAHGDPTASAFFEQEAATEAQRCLGEALRRLKARNPRQHDAVVSRFVDGRVPAHEDKAAFEMIRRAITSLTTMMNLGHKRTFTGDKFFEVKSRSGKQVRYLANPEPGDSLADGPGTRQAIPVSTAKYLSKEGWDADYTPAPSAMRDNRIEPEVWDA